jgi:soluble lytic murein transglycosylase-like protein
MPKICLMHKHCINRSMLWRARYVLMPSILGCLLSLAMFVGLAMEKPAVADEVKAKSSAGLTQQQLISQQKKTQEALLNAKAAKKNWRPALPPLEVRQRFYWPTVRSYAQKHDLDPALVMAVVQVESTFNPYAVSRKGAAGLMQIIPDTAEDLGLENPFDPEANLEAGIRYLKWLYKVFKGDTKLVLAAYNAGPTKVLNMGRVPRIRETRRYIYRVMYHKERFQDRFQSLARN